MYIDSVIRFSVVAIYAKPNFKSKYLADPGIFLCHTITTALSERVHMYKLICQSNSWY